MKEILLAYIKAYQNAIEFIKGEHDKEAIHVYLSQNNLMYGLCTFVNRVLTKQESEEFDNKYIGIEFFILFAWTSPYTYLSECEDNFKKEILLDVCLQPRLNFLQSKLIELEKEVKE